VYENLTLQTFNPTAEPTLFRRKR